VGSGAGNFDWLSYIQNGGSYALLLGAVYWLNAERVRLLSENKEKDAKIEALAERVLTLTAEIKTFLFTERKSS
jgi:hypothetical protein